MVFKIFALISFITCQNSFQKQTQIIRVANVRGNYVIFQHNYNMYAKKPFADFLSSIILDHFYVHYAVSKVELVETRKKY